jgi:peptidoglycan hydrolase-like protein with peptidoglycan-binding domain
MKRLLTAICAASLCLSVGAAAAQSPNTNTSAANANTTRRRGPIFRATKEQIKQAQAILKQRNLYAGEETGKLDTATRDGLKKYQEAEGLKVTGTLNAATLQKMNVTLTDKQKGWVAAQAVSQK